MNFTQEQISELLLTMANQKDGYRLLLTQSLEAIMRAERQQFNEERTDSSNGYRFRSVLTMGGKLELAIPRSRHHNFYPLILALLKDQTHEREAFAFELYKSGLTTQQVGVLFEKLYGHHYSKSAIFQMMHDARLDINVWLNRKNLDQLYPVVYIDATFWHTRRDNSVSNEAYYTILGVKQDTTREVLAIVNNPTEGASNWEEALLGLKTRGVQTVQLLVADGLSGIENAVQKVFPQAVVQLCTVHLKRNLLAKVKPDDKTAVAAAIKEVFNPDNENDNAIEGKKRFDEFIDKWIKKYPSFKPYKHSRYALYFNYLNYEKPIRRMIYSTNWIERLNRTYKRTLRMRSSLPSPESVVFLLGSTAANRLEFTYPIYQFSLSKKLNFY